MWRGCAGAILMALALSALVALAAPPFSSIDENAHTAYALDVMHGELPTMSSMVQPEIPGMHREWTYVANHPPLYYVFAGVPLRLGIALGQPRAGLIAARMLSALFLAAGIAAAIWAIRLLLPHRPRLALTTGAFFAIIPMFALLGSVVMNDTAAFATVSLATAASILVLRRGLTWRRAGLLALACAAAALTRSSGLTLTVIAVAACLLAGFREREPGGRWPSRRALAMTCCVPAAVIAAAAWFYIRNAVLYGDATGAEQALRIFTQAPHLSLADSVFSARFWQLHFEQLFGHPRHLAGPPQFLAYLAVGLVVAGFLAQLVRGVAGLPGSRPFRFRRWLGEPAVQGVLLLGAQALLTVIPFFLYASRGGASFTRYLVPGSLIVALGAAWALDGLPGRRRAMPAVLTLGCLLWVSVQLLSRSLAWQNRVQMGRSTLGRLVLGMRDNGVPAASLLTVVLLGLVVAGFALLAFALWKVGSGRPPAAAVAGHRPLPAARRRLRTARAAAHSPAGVGLSVRLAPTRLPQAAAGWLRGGP